MQYTGYMKLFTANQVTAWSKCPSVPMHINTICERIVSERLYCGHLTRDKILLSYWLVPGFCNIYKSIGASERYLTCLQSIRHVSSPCLSSAKHGVCWSHGSMSPDVVLSGGEIIISSPAFSNRLCNLPWWKPVPNCLLVMATDQQNQPHHIYLRILILIDHHQFTLFRFPFLCLTKS